MRKGGRVDLIISIIIAIAVWAYVIGVVDPTTQSRVSSVPVTYLNEETLEARGLEIDDAEKRTITVSVKGNRSDIKRVDANKISATVDVGSLDEGDNDAVIDVSVPAPLTFVKTDAEDIVVKVKEIEKSKDKESN